MIEDPDPARDVKDPKVEKNLKTEERKRKMLKSLVAHHHQAVHPQMILLIVIKRNQNFLSTLNLNKL